MIPGQDALAAALPGYDIGGELGRGGWGLILDGRHRQLARDVAIKQLPRTFAAAPEVRSRFVAEAQVLAALDHPHIVPVYDFVDHDGLCLLVMEKLARGTVWSRFVSDGFGADQACAVGLAVCSALEHAHLHGVLHRDMKPENVMFSAAGVLKVTDFGIAKMLGGSEHLATRDGQVLGTPAYMAPEQARAAPLTPATDVYGLGVMLYELLSGQLPFPDDGDALAMLYRHVHEDPPPLALASPAVPVAVATVVMQALARDPVERFVSAERFGVALGEAATAEWGPGWVDRTGLAVMAAGPIVAATERPADRNGDGTPEPRPDADAPSPAPAPAPAPATVILPAAVAPAPVTVRPSIRAHTQGLLAEDVSVDDVVPVRDLVTPALPWPWITAVVAIVALLALVAVVGVGRVPRSGDIPVGTVTIAQEGPARDIAADEPIRLDLDQPIHIVASPPLPADRFRLELSVLGIPLGAAEADGTPGADGTTAATLDARGSRYLVAGTVTGELVLADGRTRRFTVESEQPPYLTAPGVVGVAVALFLLAYAESLFRSLRRGRRQVTGTAGLAAIGLAAGAATTGLSWLVTASEPTRATVAIGAVLGTAAGIALSRVGALLGRRRRAGRAARAQAA